MDLKSFIESLSYCEESNKSLNVKLLVCLALAEYFKIGLRYDAQKRYNSLTVWSHCQCNKVIYNQGITVWIQSKSLTTPIFPWGIKLPSVIGGYPPHKLKILMVRKISTFTGRAIPVLGWIILASDVSQIAYRTVRDYNRIARGNDKIW